MACFVDWISFTLTNPEPSGESTGDQALKSNSRVEQGGTVTYVTWEVRVRLTYLLL